MFTIDTKTTKLLAQLFDKLHSLNYELNKLKQDQMIFIINDPDKHYAKIKAVEVDIIDILAKINDTKVVSV